MRADLAGLVITHGHEDHIGAVADLWPRLGCPVYATRFAAALLEAKRLAEPGAPDVQITVVAQGAAIAIGPFDVEFIAMAHSIPESSALAIRTPLGTILHSGDWKIDAAPGIGKPTDAKRLAAIGAEGVLALVSDSTNILREGMSPSEADVGKTLRDIIGNASGRVVVTTFASNVARIRAVAEAAMAAERTVVLVGRAMERVVAVARDCGYLDGIPDFFPQDAFAHMPRDKLVVLATGSQGESRAAIARISEGDHPVVSLNPGDKVIFSSRTIPGNEREVGRIINNLIRSGVEVITDRTPLVHASGHPRRGEVAQLYAWTRPQIAIPVHGEDIHLAEHAAFAKLQGTQHVIAARNGDVVLLAPGPPGIVGEVPSGRLCKDGNSLIPFGDEALKIRQRLAVSGIVTIALAVTAKGDLAGVPDVVTAGIPARARDGAAIDTIVDDALFQTFDQFAPAKAARRGYCLHRDRKSGAQRHRGGMGQAARRPCSGRRGVIACGSNSRDRAVKSCRHRGPGSRRRERGLSRRARRQGERALGLAGPRRDGGFRRARKHQNRADRTARRAFPNRQIPG